MSCPQHEILFCFRSVSLRWLFHAKEHSILLPRKGKTCLASSELCKGEALVFVHDLSVFMCMHALHLMQPVACQWKVLCSCCWRPVCWSIFCRHLCQKSQNPPIPPCTVGIVFLLCEQELRSAHSFSGLWPAAVYPGYSLVPVWFCFPCICLLEELCCIPCAVSPSVQLGLSHPLGTSWIHSTPSN